MLPPGRWRSFARLFAFTCAVWAALSARAQIIYITEVSPSTKVVAYDLATGQPYAVGSALTNGVYVPSGHLQGLATDSAGNVYLAYDYTIAKYDAKGALDTTFGTNGYYSTGYNSLVTGAAVNPAGTQLIVPFNLYTSAAYAYSTTTGAPVPGFTAATVLNGNPPTTASSPWAVAFNPSGTKFYATAPSGVQGGTTLTEFSLTGGTGTIIKPTTYPYSPGGGSAGYGGMQGLLFQTDTSFVTVDVNLGLLARYNISGGFASLDTTFGTNGFVTNLNGVNGGLAADPSGNLYVFVNGGTNSYVEQFSANGALLNSTFLTLPGNNTYGGHLAIGFAPVPEPGTVALLGCGLLTLGAGWFRRRSRA